MSNIFINPACNPQSNSNLPPSSQVRPFHQALPHYCPTPLVPLPSLAKTLGIKTLLLKDESSRLGLPAFKILGASWATARACLARLNLPLNYLNSNVDGKNDEPKLSLERLGVKAKDEGLVLYAATDGNHGRAVARMAGYLGIGSMIYVPRMLDDEAIGKIKSEGAEVVVWDGDYDATVLATKAAAEGHSDGKGVLISDTALEFGDEVAGWIVDGYQTMFDELDEQIGEEDVTHVLTPVGVGSLASAVVKHFGTRNTSVITVEPKTAACLKTSLEAGKMKSVDAQYTICSGMCCGTLSVNGWEILKKGVEAATVVDDKDVHEAILELKAIGVNAGPCGAATLAGLKQLSSSGGCNLNPESVVVILCTEGTRGYLVPN